MHKSVGWSLLSIRCFKSDQNKMMLTAERLFSNVISTAVNYTESFSSIAGKISFS